MKIKTREIAKTFYTVEYKINEKDLTEEELEILNEKKDIEKIETILNENGIVINSEADEEGYGFKLFSLI